MKRFSTNNSSGFSLVEVLVLAAIVGIIGLGVASLMVEMQKAQRTANIKSTLRSQQEVFTNLINDSLAWSNSIGAGPNSGQVEYTCQRSPPVPATGCADNSSTTSPFGGVVNTLVMYDGSGTVYWDPTVATNGFKQGGKSCTTFPSDECLIRWDIRVINKCPNGSPCQRPTVRVIAMPNIPAAIQSSLQVTIKPDNYAVDVIRGLGTKFVPVVVSEQLTGSGAGACNSPQIRQLNHIDSDPEVNATLVGGNQVTLKAGTYQCRITAPGFKTKSHHLELWSTAAPQQMLGSGAPNLSPLAYSKETTATLEVSFSLSVDTNLKLVHVCEFSDPANTLQEGFSTAPPANYATTAVTYAVMSCYKTD